MSSQISRYAMTRWLTTHGFAELPGRATSHRRYRHGPSGVAVTVPGHGPQDLSKKMTGMILRDLVRAGFTKEAVRRDLAGH